MAGVDIFTPTKQLMKNAPVIFITARHAVQPIKKVIGDHPRTIAFDAYFVVKNYERLCSVRDCLADPQSVEVFNALLQALLTGSNEPCLHTMEKDTYFALPQFSGSFDEIFVDAGAFVGDSVERFIWENLGTFKHIYAFEPGKRQFQAMEARMERLTREWALAPETITLVQAGLGESNRKVAAPSHALLIQSSLADAGEASHDEDSVPIYSLDDFLKDRPVTFIKSDIEGMELELLEGATHTIKKYRPKMALSIYHYPTDLFTIIERVHSIVPDYRFSMRLHAPMLVDYMLYCY
jgi:FkbM family methyltransferase